MGRSAGGMAESEGERRMCPSKGAPLSLPQHPYWFDFLIFVLFDVALFLVIYFLVP
uniref:Uncharacterized protein n=1 Tax=Echeneis naucrates TaxID=173247 RepID=A0A665VDI3_ECHNA